jgi:hypothetical protein
MKNKWRSFEDARKFASSLNLKNSNEWNDYCASGNKPNDIPSTPWIVYKTKGWNGFRHWTGRREGFRLFEDAKRFAHTLNFKGEKEWREYRQSGNKPYDIPSNPDSAYKNKGWIDWGDWFGTGRIADQFRKYRSFDETKKFVLEMEIKTQKEWIVYVKSGNKPYDIPSNVQKSYKKEWIDWGDFLGTGRIASKDRQYRSFEEAKKFVQNLGLKNSIEWREYCISGNKPDDIPSNPWLVYKKWNIERMKRNEKKV